MIASKISGVGLEPSFFREGYTIRDTLKKYPEIMMLSRSLWL